MKIIITIISFDIVAIIYCFFLLIRNNIVYNIRTKFLYENEKLYDKLPTYEKMLYKYIWIFTYKGWLRFVSK